MDINYVFPCLNCENFTLFIVMIFVCFCIFFPLRKFQILLMLFNELAGQASDAPVGTFKVTKHIFT